MRYIINISLEEAGVVGIVKLNHSKSNAPTHFKKFRIAKKKANRFLDDYFKSMRTCTHCECDECMQD